MTVVWMRRTLVTHAGHRDPIENFGIGRTFDRQNTDEPTLHARDSMIDKRVVSRNVEFELCNHCTSRWDGDCLDTLQGWSLRATEQIDLVENFANDMERGREA